MTEPATAEPDVPEAVAASSGPGRSARPNGVIAGIVAFAVAAVGLALVVRVVVGSGDTDIGTGRFAGTELAEPVERPDFTLTDTEGRPFDFRAETAGRLTLLFFGYTSCPDVCPVHLATLADAIGRPGVPEPVVVFVGVDPARDTPEAVRTFLDQFDASFIGLTGTPAELEVAQRAAGVVVASTDEPDGDGGYLVGHASQILAFTPDDLAHVVYPFGVRGEDWAHDLPLLVADPEWAS